MGLQIAISHCRLSFFGGPLLNRVIITILSSFVIAWTGLASDLCHDYYLSSAVKRSFALTVIQNSSNQLNNRNLGLNRAKVMAEISKDPHYKWIYSDLMNENLNFAMSRNETSREGIMQNGFMNFHETHRSATGMTEQDRIALEAAMLGVSKKIYKENVPAAERPLYLYLAPKVGSKIKRETEAQSYGTDTYLFKIDKVGSMATWVLGDSLDRNLNLSVSGAYLKVPLALRFQSWADRDLMLPRLRVQEPNLLPDELSLEDYSNWTTLPDGKEVQYNILVNQAYIEIQLWRSKNRKVTLDDVEAFVFRTNPPTGEFLKDLRRRGIKIYHNPGKLRDSLGEDLLWTKDLDKSTRRKN
jgi:hypothetical protein